MAIYKNDEDLKKEIMEQDRHLFIYGHNNENRSKFLKSLEDDYQVSVDSSKPIALYFDSLGLPKLDEDLSSKDSYALEASSREYLSFSIAAKMLEKAIENGDTIINKRLFKIVELMNQERNLGYSELKSVKQLLEELKISRDFYYESYIKYVKGMIDGFSIYDINIPFMQLESFVSHFKDAIGINSYLGIILDKKNMQAITSTKAINNLIGSRINNDISIKVAMEPDDWETYKDVNGQFIEAIHDYGEVELDDSLKEYINGINR